MDALMRRPTAAWVAGIFVLSACGGDSTGPDAAGGAAAGTWVISFGRLDGSGVTCRFPSVTLILQQSSNRLTGSFDAHGGGGCWALGAPFAGAMGIGSLTGHVAGSAIQVDLSIPEFRLTGNIRGDSVTGSVTWKVRFTGTQLGSVTLSGTWRAARVPSTSAGSASSIRLAPDLPAVPQGDSVLLAATVRDGAGRILPGASVALSSVDTAIGSVSSVGWARSKGLTGLFTVAATSGAAYTELVVMVVTRPVSIVVSPSSIAMNRTHTVQLRVSLLDFLGSVISGAPLSYLSSGPGIASVSAAGLVSSPGPLGNAIITISGGGLQTTVPVSIVAEPLHLSLTPSTAVLAPGSSLQLDVAVADSAGLLIQGAPVTFTSDNLSVIAVSGTGLTSSTGSAGFANITATIGTLSRRSRLLVRAGPLPGIVATAQVGGASFGLAVASTGAMYVGDGAGSGLARGDLPVYDFPVRVPTGGVILGVAFDPTGTRAFIARDSADRVAVVDVATNTVVDTINTGLAGAPVAAAVSPDGQRLFIGTVSSVLAYDAHTLAPIGSVQTGIANHFTFHPSLPFLYASADSVLEINLNTLSVTRIFGPHVLHGTAQATAVAPDGSELYVADEGGGVRVWDLNTGLPTDSAALSNAFGLVVAPASDLMYVGLEFDGSVSVLDRPSRVEIARLPVGGLPRRIAIDPSGALAVVVNQGGWVDFIK